MRLAEHGETHEDAVARGDAQVRPLRSTRLLTGGALELELSLEPPIDRDAELLRLLDRAALGDQLLVPEDHAIEWSDGRQLAIVCLVPVEKGDVETGLHAL